MAREEHQQRLYRLKEAATRDPTFALWLGLPFGAVAIPLQWYLFGPSASVGFMIVLVMAVTVLAVWHTAIGYGDTA